ncbi:MAG: hypothetical protein NVS1B3_09180 [Candidatus Dormibacteraceae bacterium]
MQGTTLTVPVTVPVAADPPGNWYAPHAAVKKTSPARSAFFIARPNAHGRLQVTPLQFRAVVLMRSAVAKW